MPNFLRRTTHYGIAIADDRIVAVSSDPDESQVWAEALSPADSSGTWPELVLSLERFRKAFGHAPGSVSVALMPGLIQVRQVDLPFMRKGELRRVVQRDASTFFFRAQGEQVVAIRHLRRTHGRRSVLAAAAPQWLVELIASAVMGTGHTLHQIVPAHSAWAAATSEMTDTIAQSRGWIGIPWDDVLELLEVRQSDVRQVRRMRSAGDEELIEAITGGTQPTVASIAGKDSAMTLAARHARDAASLMMAVPSIVAIETQRATWYTRWLSAAAAVLLVSAALLRLVDLKGELAHVRRTREGIGQSVAEAMQQRASVFEVDRLLARLCDLRDKSPRWSDALVTLANHLPLNAYVTRVNTSGDSVSIEGAADAVAEVLEQLRGAPGVAAVHASAPIRLAGGDGEDAAEYFSLVMQLPRQPEREKRP